MPNTIAIEALTRFSEVLATASEAADDTADALAAADLRAAADALAAAGVNDVRPDATQAGVYGIESTTPQVIEAVLRIAEVVGQTVTIDYVDEFGQRTYDRAIMPQEFVSQHPGYASGQSVIAIDDYRDGETRRFRLDRIQRVSC